MADESIEDLAGFYTRQRGFYELEDLLAAGFSPSEVLAFSKERSKKANTQEPVPIPAAKATYARDRAPTLREKHAAALAELFGGEDYDRGDLLRARRFTGSDDPTATFADSTGLADFVGLGGVYGTQEGANTAVQGIRSGDLGTVALGVGETVLNALGAVPGLAAALKGGGKLIDDVFDASRRAEADRFFLEREAQAEGYGAEGLEGARLFIPSEDELAVMRSNPSPNEQVYLENLQRAREMAEEGESVNEILEETYVLRQPIADLFGGPEGTREVYAVSESFGDLPDEVPLRNVRAQEPTIEYVPQDVLGPGVRGDFDPDTGAVRISEDLNMEQATKTAQHEVAHFDHSRAFNGERAYLSEVGSEGSANERVLLADKVEQLRNLLNDPSPVPAHHDYLRDILKDLRTSESGYVNYANNPGEIIARAAAGQNVGYDLVSPKLRLNPYINTGFTTNTGRGLDALRMMLRPDLFYPLNALRRLFSSKPQPLPKTPRSSLLEPVPIPVPMDVRRGQVNEPGYQFSPRGED